MLDHRSLNVVTSIRILYDGKDWDLFEYIWLDSSLEFRERCKLLFLSNWMNGPPQSSLNPFQLFLPFYYITQLKINPFDFNVFCCFREWYISLFENEAKNNNRKADNDRIEQR